MQNNKGIGSLILLIVLLIGGVLSYAIPKHLEINQLKRENSGLKEQLQKEWKKHDTQDRLKNHEKDNKGKVVSSTNQEYKDALIKASENFVISMYNTKENETSKDFENKFKGKVTNNFLNKYTKDYYNPQSYSSDAFAINVFSNNKIINNDSATTIANFNRTTKINEEKDGTEENITIEINLKKINNNWVVDDSKLLGQTRLAESKNK